MRIWNKFIWFFLIFTCLGITLVSAAEESAMICCQDDERIEYACMVELGSDCPDGYRAIENEWVASDNEYNCVSESGEINPLCEDLAEDEEIITLTFPVIPEIEFLDYDEDIFFEDFNFEWGFTKFGEGTLTEEEQCEMAVDGESPVWEVTEVATETHFCKNLPNPKSTDPKIVLESEKGDKKLYSYKNGRVKLIFDTSLEENFGCSITNPINPETAWIHYGVRQSVFIDLDNHDELNFNLDVKLNEFDFTMPAQDCTMYNMPVRRYGAFGFAFLLSKGDSPEDMFWILFPLCQKHWWEGDSDEEKSCTSNEETIIITDQFGIPIYDVGMGNEFPILEEGGDWANYNFDFKEISQEAFDTYNTEYNDNLDLSEYNLVHVSFDWEIMGAFDTEIEFKDFSFEPDSTLTQSCSNYGCDCDNDKYVESSYAYSSGESYAATIPSFCRLDPSNTNALCDNQAGTWYAYDSRDSDTEECAQSTETRFGSLDQLKLFAPTLSLWERIKALFKF